MNTPDRLDLIHRAMGAANVFCATVTGLLEETLEEASDSELALSQLRLLLLISRPEHRFKVRDVAEFLGVTSAAASRSIERLVQRGLVDRRLAPDNRRAVDLSLTDEGRELLARFTDLRDARLTRVLADFPAERLDQLTGLLDEVSVRLLDVESGRKQRCLRCSLQFKRGCLMRDVLGRECVLTRQDLESGGAGTGAGGAAAR
ncbi:MAG: MarR family transcriptional regulator [Longimicrobiales bacterium]|nr:MarR family transcriptional regulator [Longimicrobiales bacterium]